ncbi:MAG: transposase, partial [Armatimonadetes bacterium]|nr:transposase [Armatimonadota bacterium]
AGIDWSRGYQFLDQELRQVIRRATTGKNRVDLLAQVWLNDGSEAWVLVHVEVQAQRDTGFTKRVYRYHGRLTDRWDRPVVTLAVLADADASWRPDRFHYELWDCEVLLRFPVVKLLDLDEAELAESRNPLAVVIRAHRRAQATRRSPNRRLRAKMELVRELYQSGMSRPEVLELLRLIDWLLALPEDLEAHFQQQLHTWDEEKRMPYITSWERLGHRRGRQEGRQEALHDAILRNLSIDHGDVPSELAERIVQVTDPEQLLDLVRSSVRAESLDAFRRALDA